VREATCYPKLTPCLADKVIMVPHGQPPGEDLPRQICLLTLGHQELGRRSSTLKVHLEAALVPHHDNNAGFVTGAGGDKCDGTSRERALASCDGDARPGKLVVK
jgi:hypothetical protein